MSNCRVGYVPGVFDMFHIGHLNLLRNARSSCDYLVAGIVSDELTRLTKQKLPVIPLAERLQVVRAIRYVDEAIVEDVPKLEMWQRLNFDVIIKGDDWRGTPKGDRLEADFRPLDVDVIFLPYTSHTSSTLLRQALHQRIAVAPHVRRPAASACRTRL
ncbi:MAG TPA: adenylyltransferase/cytidyltransferase family protein [Jatrophihabitantaceae bacterium]|nr:adenylyltransferase/cytidyltransferase family protein [Jatrophihabitantaceae bacterium]